MSISHNTTSNESQSSTPAKHVSDRARNLCANRTFGATEAAQTIDPSVTITVADYFDFVVES